MTDHQKAKDMPTPSPEYLLREKRFNDAVALKKPDRVPVATMPISFMTRYAGLTDADAFYDYERAAEAWVKTTATFNFDITGSPMVMMPGSVMELLGIKTFKWPGYNLDKNLPYQFIENEYMTAGEYEAFLRDPSGFTIRMLMPPMAQTLEPLGMLPPLYSFSNPLALITALSGLATAPPLVAMFQKLGKVGEEMGRFMSCQVSLGKKLFEMGYPTAFGAVTLCPFDWVSDYLRGMRGSMFDMFRAPDKLKAATELYVPPGLLLTGKPQEVKDYVKSLIDMFADTSGLIVDGATESIPGEARPENVADMVETVFEYGKY